MLAALQSVENDVEILQPGAITGFDQKSPYGTEELLQLVRRAGREEGTEDPWVEEAKEEGFSGFVPDL